MAGAADVPQAELSNGEIRLKIYLPDAKAGFYHATRFDWSGMIGSLVYKGHEYYGSWFQRIDPAVRDFSYDWRGYRGEPVHRRCRSGRGIRDRCQPALGYEAAKPGGTFVKIGVGALKKPDDCRLQSLSSL